MSQVVKFTGNPSVIRKEFFVPDSAANLIIGKRTKNVMSVSVVVTVKAYSDARFEFSYPVLVYCDASVDGHQKKFFGHVTSTAVRTQTL